MRTYPIKLASIIIFLVATATRCEEDPQARSIEYGKSFGMCTGYCKTVMQVDAEQIELIESSLDRSRPDLICYKNSSQGRLNDLYERIDIDEFNQMKDVYGCPDCADGGAEWVIVKTDQTSKQIMFEFGNEPDELTDLVEELRDIEESFKGCYTP